MKYKAFEGFGVEVYDGKELVRTKYFDGIKRALQFAQDRGSAGYTVSFITVNKWGVEIDRIDY